MDNFYRIINPINYQNTLAEAKAKYPDYSTKTSLALYIQLLISIYKATRHPEINDKLNKATELILLETWRSNLSIGRDSAHVFRKKKTSEMPELLKIYPGENN